jgi:hypothetical protein
MAMAINNNGGKDGNFLLLTSLPSFHVVHHLFGPPIAHCFVVVFMLFIISLVLLLVIVSMFVILFIIFLIILMLLIISLVFLGDGRRPNQLKWGCD